MNCHVLMSVLHRECAPTKTRIIGVLVPDLEDALCTSLLARIEVLTGEGGYKVHIVGALGFPSRARRQTKNLQRDITVEGSPKTRPLSQFSRMR